MILKYRHCIWRLFLYLRRRKKKLLAAIVILVVVFIVVVFLGLFISNMYCSYWHADKAIHTICQMYENGEIMGNLCAELCKTNTLQLVDCIPNHLGKEVVLKAMHKGLDIVIKGSKLHVDNSDLIYSISENNTNEFPEISFFYEMLSNSVKENLNILELEETELDLVNRLWFGSILNLTELPEVTLHILMQDVWNLVQQPEYLLLKYYEAAAIFPKIIGTCGHFYMEEFIKPLDNLFLLFYPSWNSSFSKRASLALDILRYLDRLEKHFPFMHFCDVKMGHFGFDSNKDIKVLDFDMVFQERNLLKNMVLSSNCSQDSDCAFIDCNGQCDVKSNGCLPVIRNTNFQRICSNIFYGKGSRYLGLLGMPPNSIREQLESLLGKCLTPMDRITETTTKIELKKLLQMFL